VTAGPKTVAKALALLGLVADMPGRTLAELSRAADVPAPTALRLLRALQEESLVRTDNELRYWLGGRCLVLGARFLEAIDLRSEARPYLEKLVGEHDETAHLGVPEGTRVVYVDKVETGRPVRMFSRIGASIDMHSTAMGKAILAVGDERLVEQVIDRGLHRKTPNTITDPLRLRSELDRIRARGFAIDDIENEEGIRCAAAAVVAADGSPLGALSISGPAQRITDERLVEIGRSLITASGDLSATLGYRHEQEER
jgi:IclR family acetate operon transcriptional repressor